MDKKPSPLGRVDAHAADEAHSLISKALAAGLSEDDARLLAQDVWAFGVAFVEFEQQPDGTVIAARRADPLKLKHADMEKR